MSTFPFPAVSTATQPHDQSRASFSVSSTVTLSLADRINIDRQMVDIVATIMQLLSTSVTEEDRTLGQHSRIAALSRACIAQEGYLLERALTLVACQNPGLLVMPGQLKLPLVPAALQAIEHNNVSKIRGLRFDPDIRTTKVYKPDLVFIDLATSEAYQIEIKRNLSSQQEGERSELRKRMLAASTVLPRVLFEDFQGLAVRSVHSVIVDATREASSVSDGILAIADLDRLTGVSIAPAIVSDFLSYFTDCVRTLLDEETVGLKSSGASQSLTAGFPHVPPVLQREIPPSHFAAAQPAKRPRGRPRKLPVETALVRGGADKVAASVIPFPSIGSGCAGLLAPPKKAKRPKKALGPPRPKRQKRLPPTAEMMADLQAFLDQSRH